MIITKEFEKALRAGACALQSQASKIDDMDDANGDSDVAKALREIAEQTRQQSDLLVGWINRNPSS